jgi:hypothetical protein
VTSEGALVNAAVLDVPRRPRLANTVTSNTVPFAKDPATASWTKRPLISSPPGFWIPMKWPPEGACSGTLANFGMMTGLTTGASTR